MLVVVLESLEICVNGLALDDMARSDGGCGEERPARESREGETGKCRDLTS